MTAVDVCQEIYDPKNHNGRVIAILQSSACGKSRLIKELSNKVCTSLPSNAPLLWKSLNPPT